MAREGRPRSQSLVRHRAAVREALAFIHSFGVIHCDIKPENVFLCHPTQASDARRNNVRLLDFGLASRPAVDSRGSSPPPPSRAPRPIWLPSAFALSRQPHASDIYALGVLFYECLTGHPPFDGRLQRSSSATSAASRSRQVSASVAATRPSIPAWKP